MRIAIVGAGAIGCLFGLFLQKSGHNVLLIHHNESVVSAIQERGVRVNEVSGRAIRGHIEAKRLLSKRDPTNLIILSVKAYDTESAASSLRRSIAPTAPILSLQNGLGNTEILSKYWPPSLVLAGSTTEAATTKAPGEINHLGGGITSLGEIDGRVTDRCLTIAKAIRGAGFPTQVSSNIHGVLWSKAIVNSAINPITSLSGLSNGQVLNLLDLREVAAKVVEEGIRVGEACGILFALSPRFLLARILRATRRNKSSMLQDIEAGRRTEIRQLNGQIFAKGRRLKVPTPYNEILTKLVLGIEKARQSW